MVFIGDIENENYLKSVLTKYEPLNASQLVYQDFWESFRGGQEENIRRVIFWK